MSEEAVGGTTARSDLRADCSRCFGLCCVAPAFSASADFAIDKPAGQPCPHLASGFGCDIHGELRDRGFPGCTVFDCLGAGQQVAQVTFGGRSWRQEPASAELMFAVFHVMRELHELLWYLTEALGWPAAQGLQPQLSASVARLEQLTRAAPTVLVELDRTAVHGPVDALLVQTSELVRAGGRRRRGANRRGADLIGKDLRHTDLRAANLRGAYLIGANLHGADLRLTDLIGADLRGAELSGADLRQSLFVTQPQVDAARGDASTQLPAVLRRPVHWGR